MQRDGIVKSIEGLIQAVAALRGLFPRGWFAAKT